MKKIATKDRSTTNIRNLSFHEDCYMCKAFTIRNQKGRLVNNDKAGFDCPKERIHAHAKGGTIMGFDDEGKLVRLAVCQAYVNKLLEERAFMVKMRGKKVVHAGLNLVQQ